MSLKDTFEKATCPKQPSSRHTSVKTATQSVELYDWAKLSGIRGCGQKWGVSYRLFANHKAWWQGKCREVGPGQSSKGLQFYLRK